MSKEFKILSIDGGGMKGVYSARILQHLEKRITDKNPNERIVDYFDLICGTSTGGLIALALSQRIPTEKIVVFYETKGPLIFPQPTKPSRLTTLSKIIKRILRGWIYSAEPLQNALTELFGETRLGESDCLLCIPSYCLTSGQPYIFKYDHKEGNLTRDNIRKYADVALATSAAPMFFPKFTLSDGAVDHQGMQFIDGGVYGNNPSLIGLTEALHYFVGVGKQYDTLSLLSIASLNESAAERQNLPEKQIVSEWAPQLSRATMAGQAFVTDFAVNQICKSSNLDFHYFRIPSDTVGKEHSPNIQLDAASTESINLMRDKGYDQALLYVKREEVLRFFKEKKSYIISRNEEKRNG